MLDNIGDDIFRLSSLRLLNNFLADKTKKREIILVREKRLDV